VSGDAPNDELRRSRRLSRDLAGRGPAVDPWERLLEALESHAGSMRESWPAGDEAGLLALAGRLVSLAERSGDADLGASAADLEAMLVAQEAEASALCERVEALIQQCRRAAAGEA
jgi:hypothetical protein